MNMAHETATRRCVRCWQILPLDAAHFGRAASRGAGFIHHCRQCAKPDRRKVAPAWLRTEGGGRVWT